MLMYHDLWPKEFKIEWYTSILLVILQFLFFTSLKGHSKNKTIIGQTLTTDIAPHIKISQVRSYEFNQLLRTLADKMLSRLCSMGSNQLW